VVEWKGATDAYGRRAALVLEALPTVTSPSPFPSTSHLLLL
jgi:hypothetical protein